MDFSTIGGAIVDNMQRHTWDQQGSSLLTRIGENDMNISCHPGRD